MMVEVSIQKVFLIAALVALVCSAIVTISTVKLRPLQETNRLYYMHTNILAVAGLLKADMPIEAQLSQLEARLVALDSGTYVEIEYVESYDPRKLARDPQQSIALSAAQDIAGIKRRAHNALVYLVRDEQGRIATIILPIHGIGLWSTLYGFIALRGDTTTVVGIRFYEHGETPGLGGEVDNARWLNQWRGKKVYDASWQPAIRLVKGGLDHNDPRAIYKVDALSGATLTNRGVENILKFWLGEDGFGPFLANLRDDPGERL